MNGSATNYSFTCWRTFRLFPGGGCWLSGATVDEAVDSGRRALWCPIWEQGREDVRRESPTRARAGTLPMTIWPATLEASSAPGQAAPNLFHNFPTLCGMFVFCLPFPSKIREIVQYLSVLLAWLHPLHSLHQPGWEWHWCSRPGAIFLHTPVSAVWDSGQGIRGGD